MPNNANNDGVFGSVTVASSFTKRTTVDAINSTTGRGTFPPAAGAFAGGSVGWSWRADGSPLGDQWSGDITVPAGGSSVIDLTALPFSALNKTFSLVYAFAAWNTSAVAGQTVTWGPDPTSGWSGPLHGTAPSEDIPASSPVAHANALSGWAVDSTHKRVKFSNAGAAPVTLNVLIAGTI